MSIIKINSGSNIKILGKIKAAETGESSSGGGPIEIPLIVGVNNVGTHGNSSTIQAFPSLTLPTLPYVIPSGILKGLRVTTTPTLPTDFKASITGSSNNGDSVLIFMPDNSTRTYHFNSSGTLMQGVRAVTSMPLISPTQNVAIRIVSTSGSTLAVWYKWPDGQWV